MKKLTQKQKEKLKVKIKNGFKKSIHIIGYLSIVAWALLGILYACGSKKAQQVENNTAQVKRDIKPRYRDNLTSKYYTSLSEVYLYSDYIQTTSQYRLWNYDYNLYREDVKADLVKIGNSQGYQVYGVPTSSIMFRTFDIEGLQNGTILFDMLIDNSAPPPLSNITNYQLIVNNSNQLLFRAWRVTGENTGRWFNCLTWNRTSEYPFSYGTEWQIFKYICSGSQFEFFIDLTEASKYAPRSYDYYAKRFTYMFTDYSVQKTQINGLYNFDIMSALRSYTYGDMYAYDKYILGINTDNNINSDFISIPFYYGDFYVNNSHYDVANLVYNKVTDVNAFRYGYDTSEYMVVIGTQSLDISRFDYYFYLTSISLSNSFTNDYFNLGYYSHEYATNQVGFYYVPSIAFNISDLVIITSLSPYVNEWSDYNTLVDIESSFYFNDVFNASPLIVYHYDNNDTHINTGSLGGDNYLYDVMTIINIGFTGLTGLFGYMILPGISIGLLVSIPLTLTLLLFVIKMFKR